MNTKHKYIVTVFVLNTLLHNVGMSWIIETQKHLNMIWTKIIQIE